MTRTTERPILFSGPMVQAILEGRKSQTRRFCKRGQFVPNIHMPRWASRILLEVTGVRVERLNDITRADAAKEGVCFPMGSELPKWCKPNFWPEQNFRELWEMINGRFSWGQNPWVWVIEFKVIKAS